MVKKLVTMLLLVALLCAIPGTASAYEDYSGPNRMLLLLFLFAPITLPLCIIAFDGCKIGVVVPDKTPPIKSFSEVRANER